MACSSVRPKNRSQNQLIRHGMADDKNRSRSVLTTDVFDRSANSRIEVVQRLPSIEFIIRFATAFWVFLRRRRISPSIQPLPLKLPETPFAQASHAFQRDLTASDLSRVSTASKSAGVNRVQVNSL